MLEGGVIMGMVVIAVIVAGLLGVLLALLKRAILPSPADWEDARKAEREHLSDRATTPGR
jgi:hypothetical protein